MLSSLTLETGQYLHDVPFFPFLHSVQCYTVAAALRAQPGGVQFAHDHPLASLLTALLTVNAGGVTTSMALGKPLIAPFGNIPNLLMVVLFWWLVFFSPLDLAYKAYQFKPLQAVLMVLKEFRRCKKVLGAMLAASATFHKGSWPLLIVVGTLGGCSGKFIKPLENYLKGEENTKAKMNDFLHTSTVTKACLMMSTFFTLAHLELIPLSLQEALLFAIVGHVSLKLFALFLGWADVDPSLYILKGIWTAMSCMSSHKTPAAVEPKPKAESNGAKKPASSDDKKESTGDKKKD